MEWSHIPLVALMGFLGGALLMFIISLFRRPDGDDAVRQVAEAVDAAQGKAAAAKERARQLDEERASMDLYLEDLTAQGDIAAERRSNARRQTESDLDAINRAGWEDLIWNSPAPLKTVRGAESSTPEGQTEPAESGAHPPSSDTSVPDAVSVDVPFVDI